VDVAAVQADLVAAQRSDDVAAAGLGPELGPTRLDDEQRWQPLVGQQVGDPDRRGDGLVVEVVGPRSAGPTTTTCRAASR
jgi:hypothetical protein